MIIGIPKEIKNQEYKVSLTPAGAIICEREEVFKKAHLIVKVKEYQECYLRKY